MRLRSGHRYGLRGSKGDNPAALKPDNWVKLNRVSCPLSVVRGGLKEFGTMINKKLILRLPEVVENVDAEVLE
jgi:hypothetical protein